MAERKSDQQSEQPVGPDPVGDAETPVTSHLRGWQQELYASEKKQAANRGSGVPFLKGEEAGSQ